MSDEPKTAGPLSETYVAKRDLPHIPTRPQTQRVLNDQLRDLIAIASKLGLYDAEDFLRVATGDNR